ncbi:MAG: hypothetical protein AAGA03_04075 [Planctomycetota bacterium]
MSENSMTVRQIKIFKSVDSELAALEKEINRWMRKSGARVVSMTGNLSSSPGASGGPLNTFSASDVMVILMYEVDVKVSPKAE